MKNLKELIYEAKLKKARDPFNTIGNAMAQIVTHYDGYGNAGRYSAAPKGKSGLDGDQLDDLKAALSEACTDCEDSKMTREKIFDEVKDGYNVYIRPYVYDKRDNGGNGFVGLAIYGKDFELNLTEGYVKAAKYPTSKHVLSYDGYLMDCGDFLELLSMVEWPKDHFTNVGKWEEFEKGLNYIYNSLES